MPSLNNGVGVTLDTKSEVVQLTQSLIRARSPNPPGDEALVVRVLEEYFKDTPITVKTYAAEPGRINLIARLSGRSSKVFSFVGHSDTVPANTTHWRVEPFSGEILDLAVWGRGALDMKGPLAAQAVALKNYALSTPIPEHSLQLIATCDEESNGLLGMRWLVDWHPEMVRSDWAIGEGAGDRQDSDLGGIRYACAVGDKIHVRLSVSASDEFGLTTISSRNAIDKVLNFYGNLRVAMKAWDQSSSELDVDDVALPTVNRINVYESLLTLGQSAVVSIVNIEARGSNRNRAETCYAEFDLWLPTTVSHERGLSITHVIAAESAVNIEELLILGGSTSPSHGLLWSALEGFVGQLDGAALDPIVDGGLTDLHWLRQHFGTIAYGFFPMRVMTTDKASQIIHSMNEHVPIADLQTAVECYSSILKATEDWKV